MRRSVPDARLGEESEGDSRFNLSHGDKIATIQRADSTDGMQHPHPFPGSSDPLPASFLARLAGFAHLFTRPTWLQVPLLLAGAILAPGRRTVTAALRILGRDHDPHFCTFHRILNRAVWSPRAAAGHLLTLLIKAFVPVGAPVVIGFDDTIERRSQKVPATASSEQC
jgi:DDE superfamily endonuclease